MSRERPTIVAANWKMHAPDPAAWLAAFDRALPRERRPAPGLRIVLFPPFPLLPAAARALASREDVELGAQNSHWQVEGAFTGEVSPPMIAAAGARWVLVGHSERRQLFGETDEMCGRKVRAALEHGLRPMLCVGETLEEREAGRARAVVLSQLTRAADGLDREGYRRLAIAYEPVWAIGTGRTAAPRDAQEMHAAARDVLAQIASPELARAIPVLYGGSVKPDNAVKLLAQPDVDGALVGGASLDPVEFSGILAAACEAAG
ncbi:MAG TPA: triose-phosphate isomerase [Gemmatimonadota bacterium]|nr:triose-phosphate isomerase [Gemmatimonadota bacterium]